MVALKNILVAVDFNDSVDKLLNYGESIAEKFGAKLWIVHVAAPDPDFVGYETGPQYIRDARANELKGDHKKIQDLCNTFIGKKVEAEALLIQGSTVETLIEEVNSINADLLIVGTHHHSFLHNLFSESVSSKLFDKVKTPLLAIPIE
jgi:nucleotide-binding universal stress UspA family protein